MNEQAPREAAVDVKEQLEGFHKSGDFTTLIYSQDATTLRLAFEALGLGETSPKIIVQGFISNDVYNNELSDRHEIIEPRSVEDLLETIADNHTGLSDYPNDFTVGIVFELDERTWAVIRYKSEECDLVSEDKDEADEDEDSDEKPETDFVRDYELALCSPGTPIDWENYFLQPGLLK
ncbi:MAG TPA: hypothetical protein VLG13_01110 [Patescibacteria group bacterium]|nr:hypothetical protein [Patescibacteria group bacterium]